MSFTYSKLVLTAGPLSAIYRSASARGAALLQTKLRRKVSIRYMRAEDSYCLEFGGISTLQRDIWCTHGRYHLLSDDTSAACRACNAPHDLLLLFSVESRFIRKRLDIWLGVGYRSTDCHERPALSAGGSVCRSRQSLCDNQRVPAFGGGAASEA